MRRSDILGLLVVMAGLAMSVAAQDSRLTRKDIVDVLEDADSLGKTVNFAGVLRGGELILDPTCIFGPDELGPSDQCVITTGSAANTSFDAQDLGSITLPANTFHTNMYMIPTHFLNYELFNTTATYQGNALFRYDPYMTIESTALNDPRAINPDTNQPLNGKVEIDLTAVRTVDRSLSAGERIHERENYSRALIAGINRAGMVQYGVPPDVTDKMFRNTMTIRIGIRGRTRFVDFAEMFWLARIMGN